MKKLQTLCILGFLLACSSGLQAQIATDAQLKKTLGKVQLTAEQAPNGRLKVTLPAPGANNRKQTIFFDAPSAIGSTAVRKVFTIVYQAPRRLSAQQQERLMALNAEQEYGAYAILNFGEENIVLFSVTLPGSLKGNDLREALQTIAANTDLVEQELTNEDKF